MDELSLPLEVAGIPAEVVVMVRGQFCQSYWEILLLRLTDVAGVAGAGMTIARPFSYSCSLVDS
jgi:hypothetical protein